MTEVKKLLDTALAESLILAQYESDPIRQMRSRLIVDRCGDHADRLDVELKQLRAREAVKLRLIENAERYARVFELLRDRVGIAADGEVLTAIGKLIDRVEACPCYCRPAVVTDDRRSRHVVETPESAYSDWSAVWPDDYVFVCTRCEALGRIRDERP